MKTIVIILILVASFSFCTLKAQKYDIKESDKTIDEFKKKDSDLSEFFESAYGYAVLYSVGKGAIGVGGAGGKERYTNLVHL